MSHFAPHIIICNIFMAFLLIQSFFEFFPVKNGIYWKVRWMNFSFLTRKFRQIGTGVMSFLHRPTFVVKYQFPFWVNFNCRTVPEGRGQNPSESYETGPQLIFIRYTQVSERRHLLGENISGSMCGGQTWGFRSWARSKVQTPSNRSFSSLLKIGDRLLNYPY